MLAIILYLYVTSTSLLAAWLGWNMYRKLDRFDWAYRRFDIWVEFFLTLLLWPIVLLTSPKTLLSTDMRPSASGPFPDYADTVRKRAQFMENPPPCGEWVRYQSINRDGKGSGAEFYFPAAAVEEVATQIALESPGIIGMRGAAKWASLRDGVTPVPTPVPGLLVNFDNIIEQIIESGIGHVRCLECGKTYMASEVTNESSGINFARSGWVYAFLRCPSRHVLQSREVMHVLFNRHDD